ncbi:MAG: hypothetical protein AAF211_00460 [Myxococcota bacterium]
MTLFALLAIVLGCAPTCDQVCRKTLFDCDLSTERVALATCIDQCDRQRTLYEDQWENDQLAQAFDDHRRCLMRESCEAIADGECFDEDLFVTDGEDIEDPFDPFAPDPTE